jgi:xanthine dehydrogenase YagS FAD-binding subunit
VIVHPSTLAPALVAYGATIDILGAKGKRSVAAESFFKAPATGNEREHVLEPNEIVLGVTLEDMQTKSASYEVRHKQAYDWPLVQAAVSFKMSGNNASGLHFVLGHVAPTPVIAKGAAKAVEGKEITEETAAAAGKGAIEGAKPLSQNAYKVKLIEVAVKRALLIAAGHKKYWEA